MYEADTWWFLRVLAGLAAAAAYLAFWWLVATSSLLFAPWRGYDVPGHHEPGMSAWWGWLLYAAWWVGLVAVGWLAAFRLQGSVENAHRRRTLTFAEWGDPAGFPVFSEARPTPPARRGWLRLILILHAEITSR